MNNLFFYSLLGVFLLLITALYFWIEKKYCQRKISVEQKNISLTQELSVIVIKYYELYDKKDFIGLSNIRKYILQCQYIILNYPFRLFELDIITFGDAKRKKNVEVGNKKDDIDVMELLNELKKCNEEVRELFFETNHVFQMIYKETHPVKYKFCRLKSYIVISLISILLKLLKKRRRKYKSEQVNRYNEPILGLG